MEGGDKVYCKCSGMLYSRLWIGTVPYSNSGAVLHDSGGMDRAGIQAVGHVFIYQF